MGEVSSLPDELGFLLKGRAPGKRQIKPVSAEKAQASLAWVKDMCGDDDDDDDDAKVDVKNDPAEGENEEMEAEAEAEEKEEIEEEEEEEEEDEEVVEEEEVSADEDEEMSVEEVVDGAIDGKAPKSNGAIKSSDRPIKKYVDKTPVDQATIEDEVDASSVPAGLSFLLKSRAPGKRKVKPVSAEKAAFLAECGGSDDDDQDFQLGDEQNDDEDDTSSSDDDSYAPGGEMEADSMSSAGSDVEITKEERVPIHIDIDALERESSLSSKAGLDIVNNNGPKLSDTLVCLVCLKETNADKDNELVQCDGCGIACHILCYGIGENSDDGESSGKSTPLSSASTEPWFCDSCRAGNVKPSCQLCPNEGGAFKLTDSGHWVHLVCALYSGCSFAEINALSRVNVNTIKQKRWGSRMCSLCSDAQFASTGVCISCDAGMCRMLFHVTCAQREGLLADAPVAVAASLLTSSMHSPIKKLPRVHRNDYSSDEEPKRKQSSREAADPFYACCKRHSNPESTKRNKRNYLAATRICNTFKQEDRWELALCRDRYERKLYGARAKFLSRTQKAMRLFMDSTSLTLCYQSRPLTSCPLAVKKAINKAKFGAVEEEQFAMSPTTISSAAATASHYCPLSFSSRFFQYFEARNRRIDELISQCASLESQQKDANREEAELKKTYEVLYQSVRRHRDQGDRHCAEATEIHSSIADILNTYFNTEDNAGFVFTVPPLPSELAVPTDRKQFENELKETAGITIYECSVCKQTRDQHMLMQCDTCKRRFHCFCLDPPLSQPWSAGKTTRRSSAKWSWECHFCCPSSTDSDIVKTDVNVDAPRQLRREIKAPVRFIVSSEESDKDPKAPSTLVTVPPIPTATNGEDKANGRKVCYTHDKGNSNGNGTRKRSRGSEATDPVDKPVPSSPSKKQNKRQKLTPPTPPKFAAVALAAATSSIAVDATVYDFSSDSE